MYNCGIKMLPERTVFDQCDPPEFMPFYQATHLSPEQQDRLDAFKFRTMKSDYEYLCNHPEVHDILGYIMQSVFLEKPLVSVTFLRTMFSQPDIKQTLDHYSQTKHCHQDQRDNIERVFDRGYEVVKGRSDSPCGPRHEDKSVCDRRQVLPGVIGRMRKIYEDRNSMLPGGTVPAACPDYAGSTVRETELTGSVQATPLFGGDYIFLRNTRCGRAISKYIGDVAEIPARPWPYTTARGPSPAHSSLAGAEEKNTGRTWAESMEERDEVGSEESGTLWSHVSGLVLSKYYDCARCE